MKKTKRIVFMAIIASLSLNITACRDKNTQDMTNLVDPFEGKTHAQISSSIYTSVLGEFDTLYQKAKEEENISKRFALMAIAEAKLLESGVMLPSTSNGGNYGISRVAPNTAATVAWGSDSSRLKTSLVVKGNPISKADRESMKEKWQELKGSGRYLAWAKNYLLGKGYTLSGEYVKGYDSDPKTWDVFATSSAVDSEAIVNTYDGLMEYDAENILQPAIAESYEVSPDGLSYTFKIRKGVKWVNYQGTAVEDLTAESFVCGFQHMLDAQGGLEYLVEGVVKNAEKYLSGEVTDFSKVGVKAVDKYTLEYTLEKPIPYFTTMLSYNVFAPLSKVIFEANGGVFGVEKYAEAVANKTCTYGNEPEKIGYCGAYLVSSATKNNSIVFALNLNYWNKQSVEIDKITWKFISGQEPTEAYDLMKKGELSAAGLNANSVKKAKSEGWFDDYAFVSATGAISFPIFLNLYRAQYGNFNDSSVAPTSMKKEDKIRTNLAMQNKNFRLAVVKALDRGGYNGAMVGDDLKYASLVNSYVPGDFVSLTEDVTVPINGEEKTFAKGTYYGEILQAQLDGDNAGVKAWKNGVSYGFDGWYNQESSRAHMKKAIEELKEKGVEITAKKPIVLELPYFDVESAFANRANALKQSIEKTSEGLVEIRLVKCGGADRKNWNYAGYWASSGREMNYNIMDNSGWGPDFGDPSSYLDTMFLGGYMLKCIGIY